MKCVVLLIAILACLGVLMISLLMAVIIKHRKAIVRWWKKYSIGKFVVNVILPFLIPLAITLVLTISDSATTIGIIWFLIAMCILSLINLVFQLRFWIKENKDKMLEWKNKAAHHAYYNLYDVIKQKNTEYGITALNNGNGKKTIPPEMIPYDVFDHIRQICRTFKKAVAEIASIDTVHITVSFIYHYTAKDIKDQDWKWAIGKDSGFKHTLTTFTKQDESLFQYLINNNNCSLLFFNDKKDAADQCSYYFSYKDKLHNNEGSVFASKLAFSNNAETCCEGIIFITTYAEKFVRDNSEVTPEEFKQLLVDEIFPCYKNLLKNELAMLYFKHKDDPKVIKHTTVTQTAHCSCEVTKKKKWFKRANK